MRHPIPGALFAVGLPSGEWAALMPGDCILTHQGRVDLPGFDIGYLDITNTPQFRIAGQAQTDGANAGTWEWSRSVGWWHVSPNAHGTYPVIYDSAGALHIASPEHNGSQGWRYEHTSGVLVTGDTTYNGARWALAGMAPPVEQLSEFSYFDGVFIGQGDNPQGAHAITDGVRRLLEPGNTMFIRVKYLDRRYAIGMTKLGQGEAVIYWLSRDELTALPRINAQTPEPPQPQQPEQPTVPDIPNQIDTVRRVREHYPTPLGAQHAACLLELAREIGQGAGLLRKDTGSNILLPDGTRVAQDIIIFPNGDGYDCLGSGETLATPQWSGPVEGSPFPASRYYKVSAPSEPGEPTEPGEPGEPGEPPSVDTLGLILLELRKLNRHLGA